LWQNLWAWGHHKQVFVIHVSAHWPTSIPGHIEADALSKARPGRVHPPGVTWLHETLSHVGAQAMAAIGPQLGVTTTIAEEQEACNACSKCAAECHRDIVPLRNISQGQKPLQDC
jgi:ferredoxin